ncbi:MAG TPA: Mur ligase domain-containing protein, partial [Polyangia bacterium]
MVGVDGGGAGALDLEIGKVRDDSRAVAHGDLFVATRGQTVDGHDFLGAAAERGAVAAVVDADAAQGFPGVRVRVR